MPREERLDFLIGRELVAPGLRQAFANPGDVKLLVVGDHKLGERVVSRRMMWEPCRRFW